jgi:hypothetical protein
VTDAPDYRKLWLEIVHTLISVGLKVGNEKECGDNICAFIRSLAQRAREGYSIPEIEQYLVSKKAVINHGRDWNATLDNAIDQIDDPDYGIVATIKRNKKWKINATKN